MRELIKVLKAVADKNRLRILKMLEHKKMCVCEMASILEITQPSVSKHLGILRDAGLVKDKRNLQWIDYSLCDEGINRYAPVLQRNIVKWVNEDSIIKKDLKRIKTVNRIKICKK
jgi:ArsR family transcriptional regulator, arsenate/arsenite/antimonite-responsive transcriptional repressor